MELSSAVRRRGPRPPRPADRHLRSGRALTVFNPLSWPRTDVARVELTLDEAEAQGLELRDDEGARRPVRRRGRRPSRGRLARRGSSSRSSPGTCPALGYRTYRAVAAPALPADSSWTAVPGADIENEHYRVEVDAARGGAIVEPASRRAPGKQVLRPGGLGNELLAYREYQNHPLFGEGPWHLTPDGTFRSSADCAGRDRRRASPIGQRLRVTGPFEGCEREQDSPSGTASIGSTSRPASTASRGRTCSSASASAPTSRARPRSPRSADAVVGPPLRLPERRRGRQPFTLDHPAYDWFGLSTTARVALVGEGATPGAPRAARAMSVAEVIGDRRPGATTTPSASSWSRWSGGA